MAFYDQKRLRKIARQQRRKISLYVGGGDVFADENGERVEGPAAVTVQPYGRTKIRKMSYRAVIG